MCPSPNTHNASIRITGGIHKGRKLKTLKGLDTRPTASKVREAIFNIIHYDVNASRWLDLFAGFGTIGLEAISRGAASAVLTEKNFNTAKCIKENILLINEEARAKVINTDAIIYLSKIWGIDKEPFDYIYIDPPYKFLYYEKLIENIEESKVLTPNGRIIVECSMDNNSIPATIKSLSCSLIKEYGDTKLLFFGYV